MLTAKDIMTKDVVSVQNETSVTDLARLLTENNISGAPVVDSDGQVIAIVTENDLIEGSKKLHIPTVLTILDSFLYLESPAKMEVEMKKIAATKVGDICNPLVTSISPDTPLDEIATVMAEKNIHTLPVLDKDKLVGVIGKKDIIKTLIS